MFYRWHKGVNKPNILRYIGQQKKKIHRAQKLRWAPVDEMEGWLMFGRGGSLKGLWGIGRWPTCRDAINDVSLLWEWHLSIKTDTGHGGGVKWTLRRYNRAVQTVVSLSRHAAVNHSPMSFMSIGNLLFKNYFLTPCRWNKTHLQLLDNFLAPGTIPGADRESS